MIPCLISISQNAQKLEAFAGGMAVDVATISMAAMYNCAQHRLICVRQLGQPHIIRALIALMAHGRGDMARADELAIATLQGISKHFRMAGSLFASEGALGVMVRLASRSSSGAVMELACSTLCALSHAEQNAHLLMAHALPTALCRVLRVHFATGTGGPSVRRAIASAALNLACFLPADVGRCMLDEESGDFLHGVVLPLLGDVDSVCREHSVSCLTHVICCGCTSEERAELVRRGALSELIITAFVRTDPAHQRVRGVAARGIFSLCASVPHLEPLVSPQLTFAATAMMRDGEAPRLPDAYEEDWWLDQDAKELLGRGEAVMNHREVMHASILRIAVEPDLADDGSRTSVQLSAAVDVELEDAVLIKGTGNASLDAEWIVKGYTTLHTNNRMEQETLESNSEVELESALMARLAKLMARKPLRNKGELVVELVGGEGSLKRLPQRCGGQQQRRRRKMPTRLSRSMARRSSQICRHSLSGANSFPTLRP